MPYRRRQVIALASIPGNLKQALWVSTRHSRWKMKDEEKSSRTRNVFHHGAHTGPKFFWTKFFWDNSRYAERSTLFAGQDLDHWDLRITSRRLYLPFRTLIHLGIYRCSIGPIYTNVLECPRLHRPQLLESLAWGHDGA